MTCIAVYSNVAGIGNTTLVYHLGHMLADLGKRVLLVDLDPQASLTSLCLPEERLEALWQGEPGQRATIVTDDAAFHVETMLPGLALVPGDLSLAREENPLATAWIGALHHDQASAEVSSALAFMLAGTAEAYHADFVLLDLGPSLDAINRVALLAAHYLLTPLAPSVQSLAGLQVLGSTLHDWSEKWAPVFAARPEVLASLPAPLGYVVTQTGMRLSHPIPSYARWLARLPGAYRQAMHKGTGHPQSIADDPECLGLIHHYAGLMPLALDARKPMFDLRPADGAIGSQMDSVQRCREDFERLANQILTRTADG